MIDRSISPNNWSKLKPRKTVINGNSVKSFIENISSSMITRTFGAASARIFSNYFSTLNPFKVVINGKVVEVRLMKRSNRYPTSDYMEKFSNMLFAILQNEISSKDNIFTPYSLEKINETQFKIKDTIVLVKLFVDVTRTERQQIGYIKSCLKKIFDSGSQSGIINFKIDGDSYSITLTGGKDIHYFVSEVGTKYSDGETSKADLLIKTDQGSVYISLKGETYRQFSGIRSLKSEPEVEYFLNELEKITGDKSGYYKKIQSSTLIQKSMYGINYGGPKGLNNVNYIIVGNITFNQNSFGASTKIYKEGAIVDNAYIVSSHQAGRNTKGVTDAQLFRNLRIGIYDTRYMEASNEIK
jgi:hypothetical protein